MNLLPYEDFKETATIPYGSIASSASANKAPLFIKNELNELYNYTKMKFSEDPFEWDARYAYTEGNFVAWNGKVYIATADNGNQEPPNAAWSVFNTNSLDLELKYVQISSNLYINLLQRSGYMMMRSAKNSTAALMSPKNGLVAWDDGSSSSLGLSTKRFKNIYGVNGYFSNVQTGDIKATTGTIGSLKSTTITADYVDSVASSAKYADIAEKYTSDKDYSPGTVLGFGGESEVTSFDKKMVVAGVVSTEPGYLLNYAIDGAIIALKGRVPCNINGKAKKGDFIIADKDGKGIAVADYTFKQQRLLLGVAIYDSIDGVVEIKV